MATIKDVAKRANVAISTVSNVITGKKYVSNDIRERVEKAITELQYSTNYVARSMKSKQSMKIGFIALDLCGLFFPFVLKSAYGIASENGYSMTVSDSNSDFEQEKQNITDFIAQQVDGIIFSSIVPDSGKEEYASYLKKEVAKSGKQIFLVSIERDFSMYGIYSICTDYYPGACEAVQHLIDQGCRFLAHITAPEGTGASRLAAFKNTLEKNGITPDPKLIIPGDLTHTCGYECAMQLLKSSSKCDGIFVANDQMALGVLQAMHEQNVRVPEDMKIVGFDDIFINQSLTPPLSSVHVQKRNLGSHAMQTLLRRIREDETSDVFKETLPSHLVIRASSDESYDITKNIDHTNW